MMKLYIFICEKEQCGGKKKKIDIPGQQHSSLDVAEYPQRPWLVAFAYICSSVDLLYVRKHLADIVLWIKLEEFPLLGGFKAIFLQLISVECAFFKVFCNVRSCDIREQTLSCKGRSTSSLTPVGNVRFQFETFQVRNQQLRDHGTDRHKLPAGECQPGGPSPPTFVMSA